MAEVPQPQILGMVIGVLCRWLKEESVPFVIIGGMAVSLSGKPRTTQDIDVLASVEEKSWERFLESGTSFGFLPRMDGCIDFARKARVLLLRHQDTGVDVDIVLSGMPLEEMIIANGRSVRVGDAEARIPRTEDLIIMKSVARRPKDIADIEALVEASERIDWDYVSHWTRQFSEALEAPEIQETIERMRCHKA